jgi:Flp pilus assembly protein TadD
MPAAGAEGEASDRGLASDAAPDAAASSATPGTTTPSTAPTKTPTKTPTRAPVDPRVAAGIHETRTALDHDLIDDDLKIDRFGFSRGAVAALFVAGFVAVLIVMLLIRRAAADGADAGAAVVDAGAAADAVVVDAGAAADAGAVDAGAAADAGVVDGGAAAVVVDAGTADAVVDAGTEADGIVDAGPVDAEQAEYDLQLKRAENFSRRGDFGRSVRAYKAALALRRDSVTAHLGLGEAYYELDNLTAALLHLERARVLAPKDPQVYVLLGAAYQSAGRKGDAIRAYERHLALAPDGKTAHDVRAILRGLKN